MPVSASVGAGVSRRFPNGTADKGFERAPHAARVSASQAILERAYGKAPTLNTSDPTVMKRAIDMTDDELAAIASRAHLTIVK